MNGPGRQSDSAAPVCADADADKSTDDDQRMLHELVTFLGRFDSIVVAFSGGVDSSVVAAAARRSGRPCVAVTAKSPAVAAWQLELATRVADQIGIRQIITETDEWQRDGYRRNDRDRCYHCKQSLYDFLGAISKQQDGTIVSGTNADDLGDHRPGIAAGREADVVTPLADLGIGKLAVRRLARRLGLSNAELPASPCLASRIAYGVEVTPERLSMVERAEDWLRHRGWAELRVRLHADQLARIEVPSDQVESLARLAAQEDLTAAFTQFGFRYVTVDLQGLKSGSMNRVLVQLESPKSGSTESSQPQPGSPAPRAPAPRAPRAPSPGPAPRCGTDDPRNGTEGSSSGAGEPSMTSESSPAGAAS